MTNNRNRRPVSLAVLAETAISLALDEVRSSNPGAIPANAEFVVKSTLRITTPNEGSA